MLRDAQYNIVSNAGVLHIHSKIMSNTWCISRQDNNSFLREDEKKEELAAEVENNRQFWLLWSFPGGGWWLVMGVVFSLFPL